VSSNPELSILDGTLFEDNYALAVDEGNKELLDKVNAALQDLIDSGKVEEFTANHTNID
jgi:polar amino acid transport system substrate-binding protein